MAATTQSSSSMKALCSNGRLREGLLEMYVRGYGFVFEGYDTLLEACIKQRAIREGRLVHAHMITTHYLPPVFLRTRLIVLYAKCGLLEDARHVFDEMPLRNVVSWTAMISAYSQKRLESEALSLFLQMLRSDVEPNEFTFSTILTSCTGETGFQLGRQVHSLIYKRNFESHGFVGSSLLDMYAKASKIHEAREIFDCLPERDVVSCTAIISGYAQLGFDEEAVKLFRSLHNHGMISNYVTYASVLTALSGLATLDSGKQIHSHILRRQKLIARLNLSLYLYLCVKSFDLIFLIMLLQVPEADGFEVSCKRECTPFGMKTARGSS
ncbi:hypothetical protein MLD38_010857 [Melastoma candidum]|uniref:Uncharacterized protein n=1 Tax=Melastoma candidum TaxID=119954 RepID=A0ACB9R192_9MYRT|nr:hypothetical protein MLD38_010857 [Melastoma candidum]